VVGRDGEELPKTETEVELGPSPRYFRLPGG
jgi:hypothetical protein